MKHLIIGASSGLGRELANQFAKEKKDLILVSRDERDLQAIKSDLEIKYDVSVNYIALDFSSLDEIENKLFSNDELFSDLKGILFPVGLMFDEDNFKTNNSNIKKITYANYLSISHTINKFLDSLKKNNSYVVGFGSVSGLLGRKVNISYAAAKRALESYFESLVFDKKLEGIKIQFYLLGYLNTNLAFGKKLNLPKGNVKNLARIVYKNKNKKNYKRYYPYYWNFIAIILKLIPFNLLLIFKNFLK